MSELSLNILDIAENSVRAGATLVRIELYETDDKLSVSVSDDGCGMSPETLEKAVDTSFSTKRTQNSGLGLPLFKAAAERTGGDFFITSRSKAEYPEQHGTEVKAIFDKKSPAFLPLGDITATVRAIVTGNEGTEILFVHKIESKTGKSCIRLDTREVKSAVGANALTPDLIVLIGDFLAGQYEIK